MSSIHDEKLISESLDYSASKKTTSHGTYRMQKITPYQNSIPTGILPATQVSNISWEIPARTINLAKSYISFDILVPAQAAATTSNIFTTGQSVIASLSLQDRSGQYLVNIPSMASQYFFSTSLITKPLDKWNSAPIPTGDAATIATLTSLTTGLSKVSHTNSTPINVITSPPATALAMRYVIKFSDLPHTLFALDKDLFFNQILTLQLGFSGKDRVGFSEAAGPVYATIAGNVTLSDIYMWLACEVDEQINASLISKVNSTGLDINIPFIHTQKLSQTSTSFTNTLRLNSSQGSKVLRIYNQILVNAETLASSYQCINNSNLDLQIRSSLNNQFLTDNSLSWNRAEIYLHQFPLLENTPYNSLDDYDTWTTIVDNFTKSPPHQLQNDSIQDGLDLTANELLYSFLVTLNANTAVHIYTHAILQRQLKIQGSSILLR